MIKTKLILFFRQQISQNYLKLILNFGWSETNIIFKIIYYYFNGGVC